MEKNHFRFARRERRILLSANGVISPPLPRFAKSPSSQNGLYLLTYIPDLTLSLSTVRLSKFREKVETTTQTADSASLAAGDSLIQRTNYLLWASWVFLRVITSTHYYFSYRCHVHREHWPSRTDLWAATTQKTTRCSSRPSKVWAFLKFSAV